MIKTLILFTFFFGLVVGCTITNPAGVTCERCFASNCTWCTNTGCQVSTTCTGPKATSCTQAGNETCKILPISNQCKWPPGSVTWKIKDSGQCGVSNGAVPLTPGTDPICLESWRLDGIKCTNALNNWRCTTDCPLCRNPLVWNRTLNAFEQIRPCQSVCDSVRAACPNMVRNPACAVDFYLFCSNDPYCSPVVEAVAKPESALGTWATADGGSSQASSGGSNIITYIVVVVLIAVVVLSVITIISVYFIVKKRNRRNATPDIPMGNYSQANGSPTGSPGPLLSAYNSVNGPATSSMSFNKPATTSISNYQKPATTSISEYNKPMMPNSPSFAKPLTRSHGSYEPPQDNADKWTIQFSELNIQKEIGEGAYGVVYLATWRNASVVVKTVKIGSENARADFYREIANLKHLRPHPNLCAFLGVCMDPLCIVVEFIPRGSLNDLLLNPKFSLDFRRAMSMINDVAIGMNHLHYENILHCDLAARNLLVTDQFSIKVADFGMSRATSSGVYQTSVEKQFPVRWTAPEAMVSRVFTKANDVWSFGVVMWEILERKYPYYQWDNETVIEQVVDYHYRLPKPNNCPEKVYLLMQTCWALDPYDRPTFTSIAESLEMFL
eukprot:TRINITY_DN1390_c0_g1_i1.p1 TRINITY_DN1390_c0_g1~~TRINITY_DN1390_c0_g1_i1.p1  ORF type:complete len:612 (-),score=99.25 TRINITY_DN1390_c0_g1_i1:89-1924(-)